MTPLPGRPDVDSLCKRIAMRKATIAIIGLGYVGLPLAKQVIEAEFKVIGIDVDPAKIEQLTAGRSYISHLPADLFRTSMTSGQFVATTQWPSIKSADAILICVPTPLTGQREPDLIYVKQTAEAIRDHLGTGQLIVLESTTYPGTTRDVVKPILEACGATSGKDFFLAYCPEREDPGNLSREASDIPRVVAGDGPDALRLAQTLYDQLVRQTVPVSSLEAAEATKLLENVFRAVNIALVNELKLIYMALGIDIWEVIEAAKTKPFGFMPFYPGPGLGGHCIPIDPFYLAWKARRSGLEARFVELAGEINTDMPRQIVERLAEHLKMQSGRGLEGCKAMLLGLAYKRNVGDIRESPSLKLMELLETRGATVDFYDPYVTAIPATRSYPQLQGKARIAWNQAAIGRYDVVVVATDHDEIDYASVVASARLVVDTRNACGQRGIKGVNVVNL